jgi:phage baseplate assembly protein W
MPRIPQLELPIRFTSSSGRLVLAVVEQDSLDEIATNVATILLFPKGHRDDKPAFGNPDQAFAKAISLEMIKQAIVTWEPRAEMLSTLELEDLVARVTVLVSQSSSVGREGR